MALAWLRLVAREGGKGMDSLSRMEGIAGTVNYAKAFSSSADDRGAEEEHEEIHQVPWVRSVMTGNELIRNTRYNKGMAFTKEERARLHLQGLLPSAVLSQELQVERAMINIRSMENDLQRYTYLTSLQERNERLFYRVLTDHIEELAPIIHVPTVGLACQKYGIMFRSLQRGLWISLADKGNIGRILRNWPETRVDLVVLTDGERVLGFGDLGVHGMGVCVSKIAMYTACGGLHPQRCLPICIDVGTNNRELLDSQFYVGYKHTRIGGEDYNELIEETISEIHQRFGHKTFIQFEDFSFANSARFLREYRADAPVYDDDIQGTAVVSLASLISSMKMSGESYEDHKFLFVGAEETGLHIADLLVEFMTKETGVSVTQARQQMWFMDEEGLVVRYRADDLEDAKIPYAHEHDECSNLSEVIDLIKPTAIVGTPTSYDSKGLFGEPILKKLAEYNDKPIVLALSTPAECTEDEAREYTGGRGVYVGADLANTAYLFPGLALGATYCGATKIHQEMLLESAKVLANLGAEAGEVLPPFARIRKISCKIAKKVAAIAYDLGLATRLPKPVNLHQEIKRHQFRSHYTKYCN
ncbi:NAD-dependent malic oxidoreductase [Chloropicon primus]|uniref:NAD-dependent malic oxidoreductase n=2 Tax=Chloropicon primus TaxID=1764295 RepID=A0A5B8MV65_9CHLO|nr:NAD-dependent malic oxidoreductase [Chloropicon primus]UPR03384.1 NAD-dependent malic oxidoreductase [Chloropicon primus]|eukprot:QDZ24176.1 NAD-dependent malic oxidoreductase [Chloropicon primus]